MKNLLEQFNTATNGIYSYLKLTAVDVNVKAKSITVVFIFPESLKSEVINCKDEITSAVKQILDSRAKVDVKLVLSHFDREFFIGGFKKFLSGFPAIDSGLEDGDIIINDKVGEYKVTLSLSPHIYEYCEDKNFSKSLNEYLEQNYCDEIETELIQKEEADLSEVLENYKPEGVKLALDDPLGRFIQVDNVDALIGDAIYDKAKYIEDATKPEADLVVCGKLVVFDELTTKSSGKKYYRMTLDDTTGRLNCLYFPSKNSQDKITLLQQNKEIITKGTLEEDKFNKGMLVYRIRHISYCSLPKDFKPNLIRRVVDSDYKHVFPTPYVTTEQASLFDSTTKKIPAAFLKGKTFCVFDIETTGFSPISDKIIEIAALKIVDGTFTEAFSTFVNPQIPIPYKTTDLTGITDKDVYNAPTIDKVLPDFYKFSQDTILVGQNIRQFDLPFIGANAKPLNIYFDNEIFDTLELSRKYYPNLRNYQLGTLADHFGVSLDGAHRAINDTVATAEIFAKIAEKLA